MNETPMMFSGLEAQGELNRMEELFGGPERIYGGRTERTRILRNTDIFAEYEAEKPVRGGPERERVLEPDTAIR